MGAGDTLVNAVIGAVVTIVLSFTAVSPILGGALAGYLQRGDQSDGIRVGAIAGALAALPFVAFLFLVFGVFLSIGVSGGFQGPPGLSGGFGVVGLLFVLIALAYSVGLSALGGYVGWYLASETDAGGSRTRSPPPTN